MRRSVRPLLVRGSRGPGRRSFVRLANATSSVWLAAAGLTLLLPASARLGIWLPLHLTLAGAVSIAISGNMQNFASTLSAGPDPAPAAIGAQLASMNAGAILLAIGYPTGHPGLVAGGGAMFLVSVLLLGRNVWMPWRKGLNRRHTVPKALYLSAVTSLLAGGTIGAFLGSGTAKNAATWLALRRAHMVINVLGWAALTVAGTLVTLLPTVLRARMPRWQGRSTVAFLVAGTALLSLGLSISSTVVASLGASLYAAGAVGVAMLARRALRMPRRWPIPAAAKHLLPAVAWFATSSLALAVTVSRGRSAFDSFVPVFEVAFVCGFLVQSLLGAWLYLVPMSRPAGPDDHRLYLAAVERGAWVQTAAFNAGLVLLALRGARFVPGWVGRSGAALALFGGAMALFKTWLHPVVARTGAAKRRAAAMWRQPAKGAETAAFIQLSRPSD